MAFIRATASFGARTSGILSADNSRPERHIVVETIRNAAPLLGLSPSVVATLDAMLSCLPPKRSHHTVFASNATLTFRRNGISDRSIRRHAAILQDAGILIRRDSPNKKRFTRHSSNEGKALRFGFDLAPLFDRLHEIAALAAEAIREREQIDYLRTKIRAAAHEIIQGNPDSLEAVNAHRALRRKLTLADCNDLLGKLTSALVQAEGVVENIQVGAARMTANDGQDVRHYHKSNKENIDKEEDQNASQTHRPEASTPVSLAELLTACPEAAQFSLRKIETVDDVIAHARTLAPMIGIDNQNYQAAQDQNGAFRTAMTVWALMQFHDRIKQVGAYFRSITTGSKSAAFDPGKLVRRLTISQGISA